MNQYFFENLRKPNENLRKAKSNNRISIGNFEKTLSIPLKVHKVEIKRIKKDVPPQIPNRRFHTATQKTRDEERKGNFNANFSNYPAFHFEDTIYKRFNSNIIRPGEEGDVKLINKVQLFF